MKILKMRRMTALLAFLLICNLAGADTIPMNDVALDETFTIKARQSAQLEKTEFSVQFLSVLEDSLCPKDAQCIWAGVAVVHMKVKYGETEEEYLLSDGAGRESYNGIPSSVTIDQYQIQFLSLEYNSVKMKITQEMGGQESNLKGVWVIHKDGALSSEWHHTMGKIIKKSHVSVVEKNKDKKIGTKVVGTDTD